MLEFRLSHYNSLFGWIYFKSSIMSPVPYPLVDVDRLHAASSLLQLGTYAFSALSPITIETYEPDFTKAIASVLWTRHHGQPSCIIFNCGVDNCPLCPAGKSTITTPSTKQQPTSDGAKASLTATSPDASSGRSSVVNWLVSPSSSSSHNASQRYDKYVSAPLDAHPVKRRRVESDGSDDDDHSSVSSMSPATPVSQSAVAAAADPEQFPFSCHFCPKRFAQACNCLSHLRTHTGDRPFRCPSCPKTFSQRTSLRTHLRTHTGARPYRCVDCDQRFGDLSTLTKHRRTHTGEKPYRCLHEGCGRAFAQSGNLKRHYRTHVLDRNLQQNSA